MNQKNHTFEENMQRLEQIVRAMELLELSKEMTNQAITLINQLTNGW